jgi:hypothetical protein
VCRGWLGRPEADMAAKRLREFARLSQGSVRVRVGGGWFCASSVVVGSPVRVHG